MYKNILVPVDVYETSLADKALQHAQFLAQSASGDIHLLHVMPKFSAELTRGFISDARKMDEYMINNSKEKLSDLVKKLSLPEERVHLHVRSGNVRDEVIKLADELGCRRDYCRLPKSQYSNPFVRIRGGKYCSLRTCSCFRYSLIT